MPSLYTYCIPLDDGAAPNPFWGICTLTICKPKIRRTASIGDWIVGLGSKNTPTLGCDFSGKVVYMMKVSDKKTLAEYDQFCREYLPLKIPEWSSDDTILKVGDCLYDYSGPEPIQREGVHSAGNMVTDISGEFTLLSNYFYYFGRKPIELPKHLHPIIRQGQGHRRQKNDKHFQDFLEWVNSLRIKPCTIMALPEMWDDVHLKPCAISRCTESDEED